MSLFKKDIRLEYLNRLQYVQNRIKELEQYIEIPVLRDFYTSTTSYPSTIKSASIFIKEVMDGERSPHVYAEKGAYSYSDSKTFWSALERYCHEMMEYCTNREENISELNRLRTEEQALKRYLEIT